jgi:hypothetical protein
MSYGGAEGFNAEGDTPSFIVAANNGFRAWRMPNIATGRLHSLCMSHEWHPGINRCNCGAPGPGSTWGYQMAGNAPCEHPTKNCSHGFYAYYAEDYYMDGAYNTGPRVNGLLEGFGHCVIGSKGFRAQFGIISAIVEPYTITDRWLEQHDLNADEAQALVRAGIEHAYPSVPIFPNVAAMLAVIPLKGRPAA